MFIKNSAWEKYKKSTDGTLNVEQLTEDEKKSLFADVWSIDVRKKERMWILLLFMGVMALIIGGIHWNREENTLREENFVNIKEVNSENERAYYTVEGLMGPVVYDKIGYYYIAIDGENVALVYINNDDVSRYQSYRNWLYSINAVKPDKTKIYGYSMQMYQELSDMMLQVLNQNYGEIYNEEILAETFGDYVLVVQDINDMRAEYLYEVVVAFFIGCLLTSFGIVMMMDAKKKN